MTAVLRCEEQPGGTRRATVMPISGLKIVCDGTLDGTHVIDKATGEDLTEKIVISKIVWVLDAETLRPPTCELTVIADVELVTAASGVTVQEQTVEASSAQR